MDDVFIAAQLPVLVHLLGLLTLVVELLVLKTTHVYTTVWVYCVYICAKDFMS